ncbi:hypothetical protein KSD_62320 [Ktedonobacter sp. SOSP1-85]|nr:hypothetical protein KSD_62320 [Ktedonobacter sp. SOSP1-85]
MKRDKQAEGFLPRDNACQKQTRDMQKRGTQRLTKKAAGKVSFGQTLSGNSRTWRCSFTH